MTKALCGIFASVIRAEVTLATPATCFLLLLIVTSSLAQIAHNTDVDGTKDNENYTYSYQDGLESKQEAEDHNAHHEQLINGKKDSTLLLAQVLFRHGDRSALRSFPTDVHQNAWPQGYGQLTELGMAQGFELGQFLDRRYTSFLGPIYKPDEVHIQSSDTDRTLMTAQSVGAGLFHKQAIGRDRSQSIQWQPVPVHTMPRKYDKMLSPDKVCDYVKELKYGLKAYFYSKQDIMKDKRTMFALSEYSGLVMNFTTLHYLADTLFCQKVHNMSLPGWLDDGLESRLMSFYHRLPVLMPEEAKYLAGVLLETLTENMVNKAHSPLDKSKLYLYSAHQGNMQALMSLLGVFHKDTKIPYASAVILELHKIRRKLYVKLLYKTKDASEPEILRMPGCRSNLCPLSTLTGLYEESAQKAWEDVCGQASKENLIDFGENTIPILVAVLILFIFLDFFLLYKTFKYRQRLLRRNGKDSYALVRTDMGSISGSGSDADGDDDDDCDGNDSFDDTHHLLIKKHSDRHQNGRNRQGTQALNGRRKVIKSRGKGKRSTMKGSKGIDSDDSYEETSLFVAPPN